MKNVKVTAFMVEEISEGFTSGISKKGIYTELEIKAGKHNELTKDIKLIDGFFWQFNFDRTI